MNDRATVARSFMPNFQRIGPMNEERTLEANQITPHQHDLTLPFHILAAILIDPDPDPRRGRSKATAAPVVTDKMRQFLLDRAAIQRPFAGAKKTNVPRYRSFISQVLEGHRYGDMPQVVLWTRDSLASADGFLRIPYDLMCVIVDGETQIAARFDLMFESPARGMDAIVSVRLHHGVPVEAGKQIFYERNVHSVTVPVAFAIGRDMYDATTAVAQRVADVLGEEIVTTNADPARLSLNVVRQAVIWDALHKLKVPVRLPATFATDLQATTTHLLARVAALRSRLQTDPRLRRPAAFIACTDRRVTLAHVDARRPDDPQWNGGLRHSAAGIEASVSHLLQADLPFPQSIADGVDGNVVEVEVQH